MTARERIEEKLFSVLPTGRFARPWGYGYREYGFSDYGEDAVIVRGSGYGDRVYGKNVYGDYAVINGVYIRTKVKGKRVIDRYEYRAPGNPRTETQQANRQKMQQAVSGWQALSEEQKEPYRTRAQRRKFSGYNLFLREYLRTH